LMDFNGVIINDEPIQHAAYREMFKADGIDVTDEMYYSRLGMHDKAFVASILEEAGKPADLDYVLGALRFLLEPAPTAADVHFAYAGWRSLPRRNGPPGAMNREAFVVEEALPAGSLHTIVGGKLTTHRALAERTIARIFGFRDPSPTRWLSLPGGDGPAEVTEPLWWRHGSRTALVRGAIEAEPDLGKPLCPHRPFLVAELVHAMRHDGASTFADVMIRRLVHSLGPCLQDGCLRQAHVHFLRERKWDVDLDAAETIARLRAEVRALTGDLDAFRRAGAATP